MVTIELISNPLSEKDTVLESLRSTNIGRYFDLCKSQNNKRFYVYCREIEHQGESIQLHYIAKAPLLQRDYCPDPSLLDDKGIKFFSCLSGKQIDKEKDIIAHRINVTSETEAFRLWVQAKKPGSLSTFYKQLLKDRDEAIKKEKKKRGLCKSREKQLLEDVAYLEARQRVVNRLVNQEMSVGKNT